MLRLLEGERGSEGGFAGDGGSGGSSGSASAGGSAGTGAEPVAAEALIHRYDFEGEGAAVVDRVGGADGALEGGATLDGQGGTVLDGAKDFVSLPPGLISGLDGATLLAWLTWNDSPCWQRVFDFGSQVTGSEGLLVAETSLFLAPEGCGSNVMVASVELPNERYPIEAPGGLPAGRLVMAGVVVDPSAAELRMVLDGSVIGRRALRRLLSEIDDTNAWLGRSLYEHDRFLNARFDEFRIYSRALDDAELLAIFQAGPDQPGF